MFENCIILYNYCFIRMIGFVYFEIRFIIFKLILLFVFFKVLFYLLFYISLFIIYILNFFIFKSV